MTPIVSGETKQYIIAMLECADGNASVGTQWIECAIFESAAPIQQIMEWKESIASSRKISSLGKLMISRHYQELPLLPKEQP